MGYPGHAAAPKRLRLVQRYDVWLWILGNVAISSSFFPLLSFHHVGILATMGKGLGGVPKGVVFTLATPTFLFIYYYVGILTTEELFWEGRRGFRVWSSGAAGGLVSQ